MDFVQKIDLSFEFDLGRQSHRQKTSCQAATFGSSGISITFLFTPRVRDGRATVGRPLGEAARPARRDAFDLQAAGVRSGLP